MTLSDLLPADLVEVARVQHKISPYRALMALVLGALSVSTLGYAWAGAWFILIVSCEIWTWLATKASCRGYMSTGELLWYVVSGVFTVPAWTMLGVLFWLSAAPGSTDIAIALWAAQLIYTQRFIYQSVIAIVVGNASTVLAILVLPIAVRHLPLAIQAPLAIALFIGVAFAISGASMTLNTVTSLKREKAAVEYGATHDSLTGLINRSQLQQRLREALATGRPCAVFFLDLDRFKQVNDVLGHQSGDALLQEFGRRLKAAAPPTAHVARFGGDEFAMLMYVVHGRAEAEEVCRRVISATEAAFVVPLGEAHVGVSVGVAFAPDEGADGGELMRKADIALYAAKAAGRGDFRLFSPDLDAKVRDRAELEDDLRHVLAEGVGLQLHYQPKMDRDGRSLAVEALLRWHHVRLGDISPVRIISLAEETGMIVALGAWVLREGLAFAQRWPELTVAINVSPAQLRQSDFAAWAQSIAAAANVDPSRIELEVTETALLDDTSPTTQILRTLREVGFRVALDDFGTGCSSLRHLHRFSVDRVKIDQSFVRHLGESVEAAAIVGAVIQLGHAMGLQVTAEGVETRQQREFLQQAGVDEMQGFLFSRARPESELGCCFADMHGRALVPRAVLAA